MSENVTNADGVEGVLTFGDGTWCISVYLSYETSIEPRDGYEGIPEQNWESVKDYAGKNLDEGMIRDALTAVSPATLLPAEYDRTLVYRVIKYKLCTLNSCQSDRIDDIIADVHVALPGDAGKTLVNAAYTAGKLTLAQKDAILATYP